LQQEINRAYKTQTLSWPFYLTLKNVARQQKDALAVLASHRVLSWDAGQQMLSCSRDQQRFLKGDWVETYALDSLSKSGYFHDVRGKVRLVGVDGEWDIMLTANAKLAILECKSDATLSEQFGKLRAMQRDLGGTYAQSFFVRSGDTDNRVKRMSSLYGITKVIDYAEMSNVSKIVAEDVGVMTDGK
jgi:hypothetical protein